MSERFDRTKRLLGADAMKKLNNAHVAVFGIGGVGGHAVDALARSGIGTLTIVDSDEVSVSNINRQLIATTKTVGRKKVQVMKEHLLEINPDLKEAPQEMQDKHFFRKHGANAYYGQN